MKSIRLPVLLAATVLTVLVRPAVASEIRGQVVLTSGRPAQEAVVYLDGEGTSQPLPEAIVDQRNKTFIPHVLVVTLGTVVHFPNDDTVFHNVFAYYNAKKFDLGMYPRGASKTVKFDKPGLVAILCNIHSDMSAYIMVVDTPYYAVTDNCGRFRIENVPNGSYTLHAWHESGSRLTQSIDISPVQAPIVVTLRR